MKQGMIVYIIGGIGVFFGIFLCFMGGICAWSKSESPLFLFSFFPYPYTYELNFAGEKVPSFEENFFIKERFDKEYILINYNWYQFFLYVKRIPLYFPYIEEKLHERSMPEDIKYIPIVESGLRNDTVSHAGATGIWQFMEGTAKQYGLMVNEYVDERYHFEKSTDAALRYLQDLYAQFGNWTLAVAAYNRGPNAIKKALQSQGVNTYYDLYLNEETSRYIFRIIAVKYAVRGFLEKRKEVYAMIGGPFEKIETKEIFVKNIDNLQEWCKKNGYSYQQVRYLNMWIRKDMLPEGNWYIRVPKY